MATDRIPGAGYYRGGSNSDSAPKAWDKYRRSVSAEEQANRQVIDCLEEFNRLRDHASTARARYDDALAEWDRLYTKLQGDLLNIEAGRKPLQDLALTILEEDKDPDARRRAEESFHRANELAARRREEFEAIYQRMSSAAQNMESLRAPMQSAVEKFRASQQQWERAAQEMELAREAYERHAAPTR